MAAKPSPEQPSGLDPSRVAEVIVTRSGGQARGRGTGYRIRSNLVLTAAHVVRAGVETTVRFDADRPSEWEAKSVVVVADDEVDVALLSISPQVATNVTPARFAALNDNRPGVIPARAAGFPLWKRRDGPPSTDPVSRYRDMCQAEGRVLPLGNRREGTLDFETGPPGRDPERKISPWEGMSGAPVWAGDHILGVITADDGLRHLTAARIDRFLGRLDPTTRVAHELPDVNNLADAASAASDEAPRDPVQTIAERAAGAFVFALGVILGRKIHRDRDVDHDGHHDPDHFH